MFSPISSMRKPKSRDNEWLLTVCDKTKKWLPPKIPQPNLQNLLMLLYLAKEGGKGREGKGEDLCRYDVIKLRILRWGNYSGLSRWALNTMTCILIKGRQMEILHTQGVGEKYRGGWGNVKPEAEIGVMQPQARNSNSYQKRRGKGTDSLRVPRGSTVLLTFWFWPSDRISDYRPLSLWEIKFLLL